MLKCMIRSVVINAPIKNEALSIIFQKGVEVPVGERREGMSGARNGRRKEIVEGNRRGKEKKAMKAER